MAEWLPTKEADLVNLVKKWIPALGDSAKQTLYGWYAGECAETAEKLEAYAAADTAFQADDSTANRIAKNNAKTEAVAAMRDFAAGSIRNNKKMHDEDKVYFGIHLADKNPTPHPAPVSRPVIAGLRALGGFQTEIRVHDEHAPDSRAILKGCNGCLLSYAWGTQRITDYALLRETKLITRLPSVLSLPPEAAGTYLSCGCRWQTRRGELGPWSGIESILVV